MKLYKKSAAVAAAAIAASAAAVIAGAVTISSITAPKAPVKPAASSAAAAASSNPKMKTTAVQSQTAAVKAAAAPSEITVTKNAAKKTADVKIDIPAEKGNDVSVICLNPLYTADIIDGWTANPDKVCYIDQVRLDDQGKAEFTVQFDKLIKGAYKISVGTAAKSYMTAFGMVDPLNGWTGDGYYKDDVMQKSTWIDGKYYLDQNGKKVVNSVITIGKIKCAFDKNGVRITGTKWASAGGKTYYLKNGVVTGNVWVKNARADKNGVKILNAKIKVKGKYYIIKNGKKQKGNKLIKFKKKQYFVNKSGVVAVKKIVKYKGKKYAFGKNGVRITGTKKVKIGKKTYRIKKGFVK